MTWMLTHTGRKVHPAQLSAADVSIEDIAHHLAHICRFSGACSRFYSVAEHSLLVADILAYWGEPADVHLQGLMHDAPEYLLGDLSTPLKRQMPDYRAIERRNWLAICEAFELEYTLHPAVKRADLTALAIERRDLMPAHPEAWDALRGIEPIADLEPWHLAPREAKRIFLERYARLRGEALKPA